jgi:hypothetical protein
MANKLLLPNKYKKIGWCLLIPSFALGIYIIATGFQTDWLHAKTFSIFPDELSTNKKFFSLTDVNLTNTLVGSLFIIGALLVGFTKEKNEDEYIANIRFSSLLWAVLVSNILLLIAFIGVYGSAFLNVMVYNMFTVLLIFIVRFNILLYKSSKSVPDEK